MADLTRYETLILTVPEITRDEASDLQDQFESVVKKSKGLMISFERWGKYFLAYPVKKHDYGVYFLGRFEVAKEHGKSLNKDIASLFEVKYPSLVMRSMTTALAPHQTLSYQKPLALEDAPPRDVESFIRENKMEGLLSAVPSKRPDTARAAKHGEQEEESADEREHSQEGALFRADSSEQAVEAAPFEKHEGIEL